MNKGQGDKDTEPSPVLCVTPKIVNKGLSGKHLKLNKLQKFIKRITDDRYRGKYEKGRNYLPDVFTAGIEEFAKNTLNSVAGAVGSALGKD